MSDLHQVAGSSGGARPEVSWKTAPQGGERGELRATEGERQGGGGPRHDDLSGSDGAAAVFSV